MLWIIPGLETRASLASDIAPLSLGLRKEFIMRKAMGLILAVVLFSSVAITGLQ